MKILIIGGAGYVGGAVTDLLRINSKNELIIMTCCYTKVYFKKM